ncbi:hypothetical protein [Vibrio navarrensis]|uniref:hypothetical protein n=1 Tax=Vibrio navarrensis TaxID=29495 RepID=UPI0029C08926|nr:hypothetical protein [Vibrio navarrensis]
MVFLCSLGRLVSSLSASWLRWALFSGHPFLGAKNSESCLNQFSGKREVRAAGSIRNLILVLWSWIAEIRSMFFKTMSCFGFP